MKHGNALVCANAAEAARIICPVAIAEIIRAVDKWVGHYRLVIFFSARSFSVVSMLLPHAEEALVTLVARMTNCIKAPSPTQLVQLVSCLKVVDLV